MYQKSASDSCWVSCAQVLSPVLLGWLEVEPGQEVWHRVHISRCVYWGGVGGVGGLGTLTHGGGVWVCACVQNWDEGLWRLLRSRPLCSKHVRCERGCAEPPSGMGPRGVRRGVPVDPGRAVAWHVAVAWRC